jgi:hypothetical protein
VLVLGRLHPPQHQVTDFEGSSPDLPLVVPAKGLLVASRADQGHLSGHLQQIDRVLLGHRSSVGVKGFDPWGTIV